MPYVQNTPADAEAMLRAIGVGSIDDLFDSIPEPLRFPGELDLPAGMAESDLLAHVRELAGTNRNLTLFCGAGAYDHHIPPVVDTLAARSEFATAYTPYQAEASQGTLQAIFEYQTMICELTGTEVSNASMYDGASALAEGVLLSIGVTHRRRVLFSAGVHPEYRDVVRTYLRDYGGEIVEMPLSADGRTSPDDGADGAACLVVAQPNFFGCIEDLASHAETARKAGALLLVVANPVALGLLPAPGTLGADIVVGEGQPLGNPLQFGGPWFGFLGVQSKLMRSLPGRVVGQATDLDGRRGFVLTLQAREQHIRREKATSNICTNQSLCALRGAIHLAALGPAGLRAVAESCVRKAHATAKRIAAIPGFPLVYDAAFFHEFVVQLPCDWAEIEPALLDAGIVGGVPLVRFDPARRRQLLVAVTEKRTDAEIDRFVETLKRFGRKG